MGYTSVVELWFRMHQLPGSIPGISSISSLMISRTSNPEYLTTCPTICLITIIGFCFFRWHNPQQPTANCESIMSTAATYPSYGEPVWSLSLVHHLVADGATVHVATASVLNLYNRCRVDWKHTLIIIDGIWLATTNTEIRVYSLFINHLERGIFTNRSGKSWCWNRSNSDRYDIWRSSFGSPKYMNVVFFHLGLFVYTIH